jgi:hypothetical protein
LRSDPVVSMVQVSVAAVHASGNISMWGLGCQARHVMSPSSPVVSIATNSDTFAFLHASGAVSVYGHGTYGGVRPLSLASPSSPVMSIASSLRAFAALHMSGAVTVWGDVAAGGADAPLSVTSPEPGRLVVGIASNEMAFAALVMITECGAGSARSNAPTTLSMALEWGYNEADSCVACARGTIAPLADQLSCDSCPAGSHQPLTGQVACTICPTGTYQPLSGQSSCNSCAMGRFQPNNGSTHPGSCSYCNVGTYQPSAGSAECILCPADTFAGVGATRCTDCYVGFECTGGQLAPCANGTHSTGVGGCQTCDRGYRCPALLIK